MAAGSRSGIKKEQGGLRKAVLPALFIFVVLSVFPSPECAPFGATRARAAEGEMAAGVGIGQILLMGDLATNFNNGLGFSFFYIYEASELFGLFADIQLSSHSNAAGTNSLSIKGLSPNLKMNLAYFDKFILYSLAGFGLFSVSEKLASVEGGATTLGFNLGGGFNLRLSQNLMFGSSLSFHNVFGKTDPATVTTANPTGISIGGTFMRLMLNIGWVF